MAKQLLSLNIQHDYISLRTPNGTFTTSYGGEKASGKMAQHPTAFRNLSNYFKSELKKNGETVESVMRKLTNPEVLSKLWPEWNEAQPTPPGIGARVMVPITMKIKAEGVVRAIKGKSAVVHIPSRNENVRYPFHLVEVI